VPSLDLPVRSRWVASIWIGFSFSLLSFLHMAYEAGRSVEYPLRMDCRSSQRVSGFSGPFSTSFSPPLPTSFYKPDAASLRSFGSVLDWRNTPLSSADPKRPSPFSTFATFVLSAAPPFYGHRRRHHQSQRRSWIHPGGPFARVLSFCLFFLLDNSR